MTSLSPSTSSLSSSDDMAGCGSSSLTGQRTSPTNSLASDHGSGGGDMKLHCTICAETFRSPKVLSCLHSFCLPCLENLVAADGGDRLACPECHMLTKIPLNGPTDLLPDYGMMRLLSAGNGVGSAASRAALLCTACKSSDKFAQAQCVDCMNLLCSSCIVAHQLMHCFSRHRVFPLTDFRSTANTFGFQAGGDIVFNPFDKPVVPCPAHPTERLEYFCKSCDIPVCKDCVDSGHPKAAHEVATIIEVGQREIASLMQMKEYAQAKAEELNGVAGEASRVRMAAGYHTAQTAIEDTFQFYGQVLKERRDELLQSLDNMYDEKQSTMNVSQERLADANRRLTNVCHFMDRLLTYGSEAEVLLFKRQLRTMTDSIISTQTESAGAWSGDIQFVTNYQAIQSSVQNSYGFIHKKNSAETTPNGRNAQNGKQRSTLDRMINLNGGTQRSIPAMALGGMGDIGSGVSSVQNGFPFGSTGNLNQMSGYDRALPSNNLVKRNMTTPSMYSLPFVPTNSDLGASMYDKSPSVWTDGGSSASSNADTFFNNSTDTIVADDNGSSKGYPPLGPARQTIRRTKMAYVAKFGDFGTGDGQFSEPSGVSVNGNRDILVADTNNHRVQIFDHEGRFKFAFGECGKRDGQMLYPNRVAVARNGDVVVTERSPTHQIQVYNQYGVFVRKFGADILQHPRGITVDHRGRVIVVECKVMRVVIFEPNGRIYSKFSCSQHLEFPNGVAANDNEEIFISDNRAHCVKVFNYHGIFLRQIGGEGVTNFPIGVCITERGQVVVADNHNNFNLTIFAQDGTLISAYESRVKHAQCFDVTLMDEGSVVLASKDYKVYVYRFATFGNSYPVVNDGMLHAAHSSASLRSLGNGGNVGHSLVPNGSDFMGMTTSSSLKNLVKCEY